MRKVEINTPQNVPLQYQLANARDRGLAFVFDFLIQFFTSLFLFLALNGTLDDERWRLAVFFLIVFPFFTFFSLFFELLLNGRSPGKILLKLRVIKLSGEDLQFNDYLLRWLFRWLDIWLSLGTVAALQVSSSVRGQRTGDVLANTTVIRQNADYSVSLKDLLNIRSSENHSLSYPNAALFKEEEMLLVKQCLDRFHKVGNESHRQLLKHVARKVANRMGLERFDGDAQTFLRTVLLDYVTLTRS